MIKASGEISQSALIHEGSAQLHGLNLNADGAANLSVVVYDSTQAGGKVVWRQTLLAGEYTGGVLFTARGVAMDNGIYVTISSDGVGVVNAYYRT